MCKFKSATTAILTAFSVHALAFEAPGAPDQSDTQSKWMAVAIPAGSAAGGSAVTFIGLKSKAKLRISLRGESSGYSASYYDLTEAANHVGYGTTFKDGTVLRVGVATQVVSTPTSLYSLTAPVATGSLASVELQKNFGDVTGAITWGQFRESNSMLGMRGSGEVVLGDSPSATFVTLSGFSPRLQMSTFSATATLGRDAPYEMTKASLLGDTNVVSMADWSLGFSQKGVLRDGDSLGLTLAVPLKTNSGSMQFATAATPIQANGDSQYVAQFASLQPTGTEKDLALVYATPMRFGGHMAAMAKVKLQPGHDAQAPTQFGLGIRYLRTLK